MPQFDTFSFFSQIIWVLIMFSYLYLMLCFYILPAFAATLKVRAKKLALSNSSINTTSITNATISNNSLFFDVVVNKLNGIYFSRKSLTDQIHSSIHPLIVDNAAIINTNFTYLFQIKSITLITANKNA